MGPPASMSKRAALRGDEQNGVAFPDVNGSHLQALRMRLRFRRNKCEHEQTLRADGGESRADEELTAARGPHREHERGCRLA